MNTRLMLILVALCAFANAGCQYERIVSQSGLLVGLDGAESQLPAKVQSRELPGYLRTPNEGIRIVDEDGNITLYAKSIHQLMIHISTTIVEGEKELFVEQLLSTRTKEEFYERGLDPGLAFEELTRRQRDIGRLYYYMPMGEYTPGIFYGTIGRNVFRIRLPKQQQRDLHWVGLDVVFEDYNYKLRWFLPRGTSS
jgi:hypothetical protein